MNDQPVIDEDMENQVKVNVFMMKAKGAYDRGEYSDSVGFLRQAVDIVPENASLWFDLAKSYREKGEFDEELKCYKKIVDLGQDDAEVWLNMALAYRIIGKAPEELYCLIMAADKGVDIIGEEGEKTMLINRYRELTIAKVQSRNPFSNEYMVPVFEPGMEEGEVTRNCIICFKPIDKEKEKGQILMCPHCKRLGHFICMATWLMNREDEICPVCQNPLKFDLDNYDMKKTMGINT